MSKNTQIRSTKTVASGTSLTLQNADDSKLTPPVGTQIRVVALWATASTNFSATGTIAVQDGGTVVWRVVPGAIVNYYQEFSSPIMVTTGTNDLRVVVSGTTAAAAITVYVWYEYVM